MEWYVPGLGRYGMVHIFAFYLNNCYRILYFAIVQCSQLQKMQKMKILFQLTTVLTNLLLGVCFVKQRLDLANSSTCVLEFAEPRLGVVSKGKESSVLQI